MSRSYVSYAGKGRRGSDRAERSQQRSQQWANGKRSSCSRKVFYESRELAESALSCLMSEGCFKQTQFPMVAYKCVSCPGWHFGHVYPDGSDAAGTRN